MILGQKYRWKFTQHDKIEVAQLAATFNLSYPVIHTLMQRGYLTREAISDFLFTNAERDVAHPSLLKDAEKAVNRIIHAIERNEQILIFGDYDVDGITSSALMMIALLPLGAQVNFYLPHRVKDGYGISTSVVERAAANNYKLIITVDNGITAFAPAEKARECGIDLIITDHHRPHAHVPDAFAIVNPAQHDCSYPFKMLAGVGVTFKVLSLLYEKLGKELPAKAYELLLLGTIADVVPLLGENRYWVRHGLQLVNACESNSLRVLKQNGNVNKDRISSIDIGFSITPQINALGRLESPRQGVAFLVGVDSQEVDRVGQTLLSLNQTRKDIEREIVANIKNRVESGAIDLSKNRIIITSDHTWPPGVIGLVASRIVSAYSRPTILLHETKEGILKGSCRSIPEFNMFAALESAKDLLLQFGGHAQAAGLSLRKEQLPQLQDHLNTLIAQQLSDDDLVPKITIDSDAMLDDINKKLLTDFAYIEPFGHQNTQPTFYIPCVTMVQKPILLKEQHVKCMVFADGVIKPIIFFNRPELYATLCAWDGPISLAAQVHENEWQGKTSIELTGIDVALVTEK